MDYIERNLGKGEQVILRAKINPFGIIAPILWGALVEFLWAFFSAKIYEVLGGMFSSSTGAGVTASALIPALDGAEQAVGETVDQTLRIVRKVINVVVQIFALFPFLKRFLILITTKLAVTNKRVIGKVGILSIKTIDFHIDKVDNIKYNAKFFGNLFRYYTITVASTSGEHFDVQYVFNALQFKNTVNEAIEAHAEQARKAQAAEIAAAMGKPQI